MSAAPPPLDDRQQALVALGRELQAAGYQFTTVTPATHARVNQRAGNAEARHLRDIFGWSRPFARALLPSGLWSLLARADALRGHGAGLFTSAVRCSTLDGQLYVHDPFPTEAAGAVFFGPDTYRFVAALRRRVRPAARAVDVGCGTGVGGLALGQRVGQLILADINPRALALARVNAELAGRPDVQLACGDLFAPVDGLADLVVANPPYLADGGGRTYRNGGGALGTKLSLRIVDEGLQRLRPGGQLVLYTGAPVIEGRDLLLQRLRPLLDHRGVSFAYEELDPDVFGEELDQPPYAEVERIAAVCLDVTR